MMRLNNRTQQTGVIDLETVLQHIIDIGRYITIYCQYNLKCMKNEDIFFKLKNNS